MRAAARPAPIILLVGALGALLLAGCGRDGVVPAAGDCFRTGSVAEFAWDSAVACDEPHTVEVFAVQDVAAMLGGYPRAALDEPDSPARRVYLALVRDICEPAWARATGFAGLGDGLAPDAVVLPALYGDMAIEATPAAGWDDGDHRVVCYQVFGKPDQGAPIEVDRAVLAAVADDPAAVPLAVRDCALSPQGEQGERRVPSPAPHDREYLGHLDAGQFTGRVPGLDWALLDRFDSATATDGDWAVLDALCNRVFAGVAGSRPGMSVLAQAYTDAPGWGWGIDRHYHTVCFARTSQQVTGSVLASTN